MTKIRDESISEAIECKRCTTLFVVQTYTPMDTLLYTIFPNSEFPRRCEEMVCHDAASVSVCFNLL